MGLLIERASAGLLANRFATSAHYGGADPAPPEERSVLQNTERNETRPGVIRTYDQGIMSGDEPEE